MTKRASLLTLAIAGLVVSPPASRYLFAGEKPPEKREHRNDKEERDDEDDKDEGGKHRKEKHEFEIEQPVPIEMVPTAILDVVKKEVPGGEIVEAELEARDKKIVYSFDVKAGDTMYDIKVSVDGKFISKEVDEGDDHEERSKTPATQPR